MKYIYDHLYNEFEIVKVIFVFLKLAYIWNVNQFKQGIKHILLKVFSNFFQSSFLHIL